MTNKGKRICAYILSLMCVLNLNLNTYGMNFCVVNTDITTADIEMFKGQKILNLKEESNFPHPKTDQEILILNKIAIAEARTEGVEGMAYVMQTVLNRVASDAFPNTIEGVVFEPNQFSTIANGAYDKAQPNEESKEALEKIQEYENRGQLFFESVSCEGSWAAKHREVIFTYRKHRFYI